MWRLKNGRFFSFQKQRRIAMRFEWTPSHARAFTDDYVIIQGKSPNSAEKYCRHARKFFQWVADEGLPLDKRAVTEWMKHLVLYAGNLSNAARGSRLSGVRSVCNWLVERGELDSNPCDGVPTPKAHKKSAQKFSKAELTALFAEPEHLTVTSLRDRCILMLFYATGLRREEMSNLTLERVTLGQRTGRVNVVGKGAKHRVVPFIGPVVPLLKTWLIARQQYVEAGDHHLFISLHGSRRGTRMGVWGMHSVIKRVAKRVGLRETAVFLHKLRSTYATDLYEDHVEPIEISILLGHSSILTTQGYIAISERHLQKSRISPSRWEELGVKS